MEKKIVIERDTMVHKRSTNRLVKRDNQIMLEKFFFLIIFLYFVEITSYD